MPNPIMLMLGLSHPQVGEDRWHRSERRAVKVPSIQIASDAHRWEPIGGWDKHNRQEELRAMEKKYGRKFNPRYHPTKRKKGEADRSRRIYEELNAFANRPAPVRATPHPLKKGTR